MSWIIEVFSSDHTQTVLSTDEFQDFWANRPIQDNRCNGDLAIDYTTVGTKEHNLLQGKIKEIWQVL